MSAADEPLGSAGEEAARLLQALGGWWATGEQLGPGDPQGPCRYCPWCRAVSAARVVRPEVVEHLLGAAESLAAALRELSRQPGGAAPSSRPSSRPSDRPDPARRAPRTVPIPVEPDDGQEER